jgi:hypothetical protein
MAPTLELGAYVSLVRVVFLGRSKPSWKIARISGRTISTEMMTTNRWAIRSIHSKAIKGGLGHANSETA